MQSTNRTSVRFDDVGYITTVNLRAVTEAGEQLITTRWYIRDRRKEPVFCPKCRRYSVFFLLQFEPDYLTQAYVTYCPLCTRGGHVSAFDKNADDVKYFQAVITAWMQGENRFEELRRY